MKYECNFKLLVVDPSPIGQVHLAIGVITGAYILEWVISTEIGSSVRQNVRNFNRSTTDSRTAEIYPPLKDFFPRDSQY